MPIRYATRLLRTFMLLPLLALALSSSFAQAREITLNLSDADINTLISTVADVTGKNFIVDPRVKGKITVISKHPMNQEEIYRVFLSILQVHGFSAVQAGAVTKIIPDITAKQAGVPVGTSSDPSAEDEFITQVIPVENVAAAQLVPILRPLVPQQSHLAAYPPTNVLIISDRQGNIDRMLDIIRRIDKASNDEVEVIRLENASASETARILTALYQKNQQNQPQDDKLQVAADERTNSLLLSGDKSARVKARAIIAHLDAPLAGDGGSTQVIYLNYAVAKDIVPVLTGVSENLKKSDPATAAKGKGAAASSGVNASIDIQADEATNALVITAPPKVMLTLKTIISQLDVRRAQVMVESIIVEVSQDMSSSFGVDWAVDGTGAQNGAVGLTNLTGALASLLSFSTAGGAAGAAAPGGVTLGIGDFRQGRTRFGAVVNALASDSDANILSTPTIVTMDNQEAEIRVAENVPFVTGQFTNTGSSGGSVNPFQTIQREDVGLILKVKPQINEGNAIKLDIEQEISSLSASASQAVDLTTKKRSIKTTVIVADGQVIVLGGLIDDDVQDVEQKVPGLGDVPVIGNLFKSRTTNKKKRNLMVFLHPTIIRDDATANAHTNRKYNYMRAEQIKRREVGTKLLRNDGQPTPVLPSMEELTRLPAPFKEMQEAQTHPAKTN